MHRFLSNIKLTSDISLRDGAHFHQILHVFRSKKGDKFIFFEAHGYDVVYEIVQISKKEIQLKKREELQKPTTGNTKNITVYQAFPNKLSTLEVIVQKLVEIGVSRVVFFPSDHAQLREISAKKIPRIHLIATEALEQSGHTSPMIINFETRNIYALFADGDSTQNIAGFPSIGRDLTIDKTKNSYSLWIGPEGGWSQDEEDFFMKKKVNLWTFNSNILRMETASIVGAGILTYLVRI